MSIRYRLPVFLSSNIARVVFLWYDLMINVYLGLLLAKAENPYIYFMVINGKCFHFLVKIYLRCWLRNVGGILRVESCTTFSSLQYVTNHHTCSECKTKETTRKKFKLEWQCWLHVYYIIRARGYKKKHASYLNRRQENQTSAI